VLDNFFGPIIFNENITLWNNMHHKKKEDTVTNVILNMHKDIVRAKTED
jgi:hypothetical protein